MAASAAHLINYETTNQISVEILYGFVSYRFSENKKCAPLEYSYHI